MRPILAFALATLAAGCIVDRHFIDDPVRDRVIRVETGDRFYATLDEPANDERRWLVRCDDDDIEVLLDHEPGCAKVRVRVFQGYDGPTCVHFRYGRSWNEGVTREFAWNLFERTGDTVFWK